MLPSYNQFVKLHKEDSLRQSLEMAVLSTMNGDPEGATHYTKISKLIVSNAMYFSAPEIEKVNLKEMAKHDIYLALGFPEMWNFTWL